MFHLLVEGLTIAATIGGGVIAVLPIENKYQPEIEIAEEKRKKGKECFYYQIQLE
jgi:hypothetical protein